MYGTVFLDTGFIAFILDKIYKYGLPRVQLSDDRRTVTSETSIRSF
jgi:hypothetical protein